MALITLVGGRRTHGGRRTKVLLVGLGIFGASLFFGDSMITPAISVLSAVEGLKVVQPSLAHLVVPITAVIIVVLFATQRIGSAAVGRLFGPVMIVWFLAIGACGVSGVAPAHGDPEGALADVRRWGFCRATSRWPSSRWPRSCSPSPGPRRCTPTWATSGAPRSRARGCCSCSRPASSATWARARSCSRDPHTAVRSPFFLLVPHWGRLPMVLLATLATVIASQAVITGAFSVAHQAVQLGYLPRLRVTHTSAETAGQIYVPWINWLLMVSVLTLVFTFQTANALAFAFGMAVTGDDHDHDRALLLPGARALGAAAVAGRHRRGRLPDRRPPVLRREPDQADPRRMAAAADRRRGLHDLHHLAARTRPRDEAPGA